MVDSIEKIIEEFNLTKEDLNIIDEMIHKKKSHLLFSNNWEQDYIIEFKICVNDYLESKPKDL